MPVVGSSDRINVAHLALVGGLVSKLRVADLMSLFIVFLAPIAYKYSRRDLYRTNSLRLGTFGR
jgi:hypothetical protein